MQAPFKNQVRLSIVIITSPPQQFGMFADINAQKDRELRHHKEPGNTICSVRWSLNQRYRPSP